ncbi:hypothetical protein SESBI_40230 [Sesbania bispinosa]|nr:hypothetical protein SESBI_40230 [Sesbania bispinosa]
MKWQRIANAEKAKVGAGTSTVAPSSPTVIGEDVTVPSFSATVSQFEGYDHRERDSLQSSLSEEKLKFKATEEKYDVDFQQLNVGAAQSYGLGFKQALIQAKFFNPNAVDISSCDSLKELINGTLVELEDGDEEDGCVSNPTNEEIVDSQSPDVMNPTEETNIAANEDQGNAFVD